jgi:hypothetical protein
MFLIGVSRRLNTRLASRTRRADTAWRAGYVVLPQQFLQAEDVALMIDPDWRGHFVAPFDDLRFIEIIDQAGRWVQLEKPAEATAAIPRFLQGLRA